MPENLYLDWLPEQQVSNIKKLKKIAGLSWSELALRLNVTKRMAKWYGSGTHRISLERFEHLCYLAGVEISAFGKLELICCANKKKDIKIPPFDSLELAEFLGFLAGDGCLTSKYSIPISCDATSDRRYIEEVVAKKFELLFVVKPKISKLNRNLLRCSLYSKDAFVFLSQQCGFPIGEKKDRLRIPNFVKQDEKLLIAFIRGLFDTDGGFHRHNPYSAKVGITSYSKDFLDDVILGLKALGFSPVNVEEDIWIMSKAGIHKFFEVIKPHNPKHLYKYAKFVETGQVPRHKDINYNSAEFKNFFN